MARTSDDPQLPGRPPPPTPPASLLPYALWAYAILLVGGFILFRSPLAMPAGAETSMSVPRAVMTVANAATLTGFQTTLSIESFRPPAQWTLLVLMLCGATLSWVIGGGLVARALRLPIADRHLCVAAAAMVLAAVAGGAATARPGELLAGVFRSISAVTHCGMWIGAPPAAGERATLLLWLPLAVIGGIGTTVLVELWRWPRTRALSPHAKAVLALTAAAYLVGVLLIGGGEWLSGRLASADEAAWKATLTTASVESVNIRSAGLPVGWLGDLSRPAQWMLAPLMLVGAAPGGAGGGLKVTTVLILAVGVWQVIRGRPPGRVFGIAAAWLAALLAIVGATFVMLLAYVPEMPADRLLMLAISAAGNVGRSHDAVSITMQGANGWYAMAGAMVLGRVLPLLVLWWLTRLDEPVEVAVG